MLSEIQTFGECLSGWMEKKGLTPSALAAYTRGTRDATISRLMHDQLDYQRCARYITELAESYPDIDEDTLRRLRISVDVNRYGKEMYLAKQNFFRMITGENEDGCAEYAKTDEFSERLLSWSGDMCFQFLCIGVGDVEPQRLLSDLCRRKKGVRIYDFFDRAYVGELTGLLAEILPIAFSPNYELYEIQGSRSAIMNNIMIAKREDGQQLLIVYDGGKYSSLDVSKETELFDFCRNILISRHHAPKKINCHFSYNSPEAYLDFLAHCLSLEKDKAIYHIKSEIGLEYVPVSILFENFTEWAKANDTRFLPFLDKLKEIFEKRYENILTKKEPTYLIMTREGMTEFAKSGRMKDHPFCLRPFTPNERRVIFTNLLDAAAKAPSLTPLILSADTIDMKYSFIGYSRECMLVCAAHSDYDLNNYSEIVLSSEAISGRYADFVTTILTKNYVLSKKAGFEFIGSLMNLIPEEN